MEMVEEEERILITDLKGKFPSEIADEIVKSLEDYRIGARWR